VFLSQPSLGGYAISKSRGATARIGGRGTTAAGTMARIFFRLRRAVARSWLASVPYYRLRGHRLVGRPRQQVWYFAYGANMDDATFRLRRGIDARECRRGRVAGYRLRFNLEGRPKGRSAPANIEPDPAAEVWGVAYRITRRQLLRLDATEGVPGQGYRHTEVRVDTDGGPVQAIAYIARGGAADGKPSRRYLNLLRDGARAHGLPADYIRFLESVESAAEPVASAA
jgi:gamma-glutamylcyclotransferase